MHVYTIGTRAYVGEVCAAIDPGGVSFGGRILSRDESGSKFASYARFEIWCTHITNLGLTQKCLQQLFPCDTSMVVIIDDRANVWEWSPNLVKVVPCGLTPRPYQYIRIYLTFLVLVDDFFVGIGTSTLPSFPRSSHSRHQSLLNPLRPLPILPHQRLLHFHPLISPLPLHQRLIFPS